MDWTEFLPLLGVDCVDLEGECGRGGEGLPWPFLPFSWLFQVATDEDAHDDDDGSPVA